MARDTYRGTTNNKEFSKKLIEAVGSIIKTSGYISLNQSNIANATGVNRKLINLYFGSLDSLVETYICGKHYWLDATSNAGSLMTALTYENIQAVMELVLSHQLGYFSQHEEMQKIVCFNGVTGYPDICGKTAGKESILD
ncbi:TetR/AcrR family transcriptional regulator [Mucilaginibacter sp. SG538B]|uniref:TetR/AcrR family transcriptional regulator n=1 Tax=Mucilaginibacter sp. SG538B TaxID=2587021 RepID=UPI00159D9F4B|nr:TetR/AcrR family transcriptional regulator [Mucilaginibacter sp. SG538B]